MLLTVELMMLLFEFEHLSIGGGETERDILTKECAASHVHLPCYVWENIDIEHINIDKEIVVFNSRRCELTVG